MSEDRTCAQCGHVRSRVTGICTNEACRSPDPGAAQAASPKVPLQWRPFRADDETERNYVISSWLRSYADGPEFRSIARGVYFALYHHVVEAMLARSTVAIAFTPELPNTVVGFLVTEGDVVHYFHTKRRFRRLGVARWMTRDLADLPAVFTHHPTAIAARLCGPAWVLDPMRRFEKKADVT